MQHGGGGAGIGQGRRCGDTCEYTLFLEKGRNKDTEDVACLMLSRAASDKIKSLRAK